MKLLVDMNLAPSWVEYLVRHGIPAVHWSTVGDPRAPDRDLLECALQHEQVVFTNDGSLQRVRLLPIRRS